MKGSGDSTRSIERPKPPIGAVAMHDANFSDLFFIPLGLALAFMIWVFWKLSGQIGRKR
jgi:hypothetical protein